MIDSAAEALARRILVAFPPSTARTRADIKRVPVPVGRLLDAELDAHAGRFASLPATEWIDPDADGLAAARADWRDAVRAAARFPADVWEEAVSHAARLAVSHLVRPAETAAADAFADADGLSELPVGAALARVRIFGAYGYLPEIAARYAERKGVAEIDRPGLERLLRRIDRRMVEDFGPDEWTVLAGPLYELVGEPDGAVGVGLLRALFEAKGRHEIAQTMVSDTYTREALHTHLVAVMPRSAPAESSTALAPEPPAPTEAPLPEPPSADADAFVPELPHAPELEQNELTASPDHSAAPGPDALSDDELAEEPAPPTATDADAAAPDALAEASVGETDAPGDESAPLLQPDGSARDLTDAPDPRAKEAALPDETASPDGSDTPALLDASGVDETNAVLTSEDARPTALEDDVYSPEAPLANTAPDVPLETGAPSASPADPEPLWKRMLQRPDADPDEHTLAAAPDPDAPEPDADRAEQAQTPADAAEPDADADAPPPEPLWRRFAVPEPVAAPEPDDEDGWAVAPTLAASPAVALDAPLPPPQTLADRFVQPDVLPPTAPDEAPVPASLEALEQAVLGPGPEDRREWFVNTLFDASPADYEATLRALSEAPSWTAATQIIASDVFRKHRVNIYSEAAIAFTDAVEAQIDARA